LRVLISEIALEKEDRCTAMRILGSVGPVSGVRRVCFALSNHI
jgi:hypothetical protein